MKRNTTMPTLPGRSDELKGAIKEKAGQALGDKQLESEGKTDRAVGKVSREATGATNQIAGTLKEAAGDLTDDQRLKAQGSYQRLKGKVQSAG
jgi:uncharacterized protein YjbJ (UPF0337 family)